MEEENKNHVTEKITKHKSFHLTGNPKTITKKELIIVLILWALLIIIGFLNKSSPKDVNPILFWGWIMALAAVWFVVLISKIITELSLVKRWLFIVLLIITGFIFWSIVFGPSF